MNKTIQIDIDDALNEILDNTSLSENESNELYNKIVDNLKFKKDGKNQIDSVELNVDVDIDDDVVDYLDNCSDYEIDNILSYISYTNSEISELESKIEELEDNQLYNIRNLNDFYKLEILKEFFYKYSWEELEIIKKQLK